MNLKVKTCNGKESYINSIIYIYIYPLDVLKVINQSNYEYVNTLINKCI